MITICNDVYLWQRKRRVPDCAIVPLQPEDSAFETLKIQSNMVMSWLINSIPNEIRENFILYSMAHEICEAIREFCSAKRTLLKFLRWEQFFMILARKIFQSHSITTNSQANGSVSMCLKSNVGGVLKLQMSLGNLLRRRIEYLNFLWVSIKTSMKFGKEFQQQNPCQVYEKLFQRYKGKKATRK